MNTSVNSVTVTMTSMLSAELSATCNALGTFDKKTGKYLIDEYTLNTVKDLIRYLRRDGEEHEIRRHLGQTKVLQTDLLPMLIDHWENAELFDVTLRFALFSGTVHGEKIHYSLLFSIPRVFAYISCCLILQIKFSIF